MAPTIVRDILRHLIFPRLDDWDVSLCRTVCKDWRLLIDGTFLTARHPLWRLDISSWAASNGYLGVLKWLRASARRPPSSASVCRYSALRGHLDILRWARAQNPPYLWDTEVCAWAAMGNHLDVLKWLRAQRPPCPWDVWTYAWAIEFGHHAVAKWSRASARTQHPPIDWKDSDIVLGLAINRIARSLGMGVSYAQL